ncbi:hypothetical protein [Prochlorococcus marinus]|uniref:hypothetical protein n=1 Tax=Prochlorococcus marinus TaxID=1219 RepID=UPI0022B44430|nr:hypothetical protein [Prochlorococcus marinus]
MKFNYLLKAIPFLSTLLLVIILGTSNQKEDTKLRILIWNTPSLTLGTYLAISTGTGFIFSYIVNTYFASNINMNLTNKIKYKTINTIDENNDTFESSKSTSYDRTLIERDFKDPSPTIKASFRVIGKTEPYNNKFIKYTNKNNIEYDELNEVDPENYEQDEKNEFNNPVKGIESDWNDSSFSSW